MPSATRDGKALSRYIQLAHSTARRGWPSGFTGTILYASRAPFPTDKITELRWSKEV